MQIFPNPAKSYITFRNIPENSTIIIYSIDGRFFKRMEGCRNELKLDISFLKRGLYLIKSYNSEYYLSELLVKE